LQSADCRAATSPGWRSRLWATTPPSTVANLAHVCAASRRGAHHRRPHGSHESLPVTFTAVPFAIAMAVSLALRGSVSGGASRRSNRCARLLNRRATTNLRCLHRRAAETAAH
jgi:hypothetical protein